MTPLESNRAGRASGLLAHRPRRRDEGIGAPICLRYDLVRLLVRIGHDLVRLGARVSNDCLSLRIRLRDNVVCLLVRILALRALQSGLLLGKGPRLGPQLLLLCDELGLHLVALLLELCLCLRLEPLSILAHLGFDLLLNLRLHLLLQPGVGPLHRGPLARHASSLGFGALGHLIAEALYLAKIIVG